MANLVIQVSEKVAVADILSLYDGYVFVREDAVLDLSISINVNERISVVDNQLEQKTDTNVVSSIQGGTSVSGELNQAKAQSFVAMGTSISSVDLKLFKNGTPTDNFVVSIVSTLGGSALATVSVASASLTSGAVNNFKFSTPASVVSGTTYYIQLERSGARDTTNYWNTYLAQNTDPYAGGFMSRRDNNAWATDSLISDIYFVIYFSDPNPNIAEVDTFSVFDSITVSESVAATQVLTLSVSDSVTVTENNTFEVDSFINVNDAITVAENVSLSPISFISVNDSVTVTENINATQVYTISVSESITVADVLSDIAINDAISVSDSITVSESVTQLLTDFINVSDSVTVSESVTAFLPLLAINVNDSVTLYEMLHLCESINWTQRTKPSSTFAPRTKPTTTMTDRTKPGTSWFDTECE